MNSIIEDIIGEVMKAASSQQQQEAREKASSSRQAASESSASGPSPLTAFFKIIEPNLSDLESVVAQQLGCDKDAMHESINKCISSAAGHLKEGSRASAYNCGNVSVDIALVGDLYKAFVDMPGVEKGDVEVLVSNDNKILVRAIRKPHLEVANYLERSIKIGKIERTVMLPTNANLNSISAVLSNGVLCLTVPKVEVNGGSYKKVNVL